MRDNAASERIKRAAVVSLGSTILVVAFKLTAAALTGSVSVLAEALQSLLDVFMSILVVWSVRFAAVPPDEDHPYGHGKAELLTSAFQMLLVLITAGVIVWQSALRMTSPREIEPFWGIVALSYAVVANGIVVFYLRKISTKEKSSALEGEVEHLKSDTLASVGILAGLVAVSLTNWHPLDPIVAVVFTASGAFFAFRQLQKVIHPLMDGSLPKSDIEVLERVLNTHADVRGYHNLQTREAGNIRYVGLHVMLDDDLSFVQAHDLAEHIETELSTALGGAHVTLHYEPFEAELQHREQEHREPRH